MKSSADECYCFFHKSYLRYCTEIFLFQLSWSFLSARYSFKIRNYLHKRDKKNFLPAVSNLRVSSVDLLDVCHLFESGSFIHWTFLNITLLNYHFQIVEVLSTNEFGHYYSAVRILFNIFCLQCINFHSGIRPRACSETYWQSLPLFRYKGDGFLKPPNYSESLLFGSVDEYILFI